MTCSTRTCVTDMSDERAHARGDHPPALAIDGLSIDFLRRDGALRVVDGVSLAVHPGEIVGVIGESGSGKTLTSLAALRMLPKLARVAAGSIELAGRSLLELPEKDMRDIRGSRIALIPQDAMQSLNPTMRIGRQVGEPLDLHGRMSWKRSIGRAVELLRSVNLLDPEQRVRDYPHELSGGMQQRAMIAMGLALDPELIIADEPTTALDVTVQAQVLKLLRSIRDERGASILFITHDLGVVAELCDWVYVMREGVVVESGSIETIFLRPEDKYTRMLIAATPGIRDPAVAREVTA